MTDIRIQSMTLMHFKRHRHLYLAFSGMDGVLLGENGAGKTTVLDALTWLLYGRDSRGKVFVPPAPEDPEALTSVEAELTVNGSALTLRKACRRGDPPGEDWYIDSQPVDGAMFRRLVEELLPEARFRLLGDVTFFLEGLSSREQRELLLPAAELPRDSTLLAQEARFAPLAQAMGDQDCAEFRAELEEQIRQLRLAAGELSEGILSCRHTLLQTQGVDYAAARQRVKELTARREQLTARLFEPESARKESSRQRYDALVEENRRYRQALEQLEAELAQLQERKFTGGTCAHCGGALPLHRAEAAKEAYALRCARELQRLERRKQHLTREYTRAREALLEARSQLPPEEPQASQDGGASLRLELEQVRRELRSLRGILDREALADYSRQRLTRLAKQQQKTTQQLEELQSLQRLLEDFCRWKGTLLESRINALFRVARFRLFGEDADGSRERCDVTLLGVQPDDAGSAAPVKLGMDIIRTLSRLWELRVPLFIDNAERMTCWESMDCQCIRLTAAPGPLRLERVQGKEEES